MNHRIGGELDSIDQIIGIQSSTLPGGGFNLTENSYNSQLLLQLPGGQRHYSFKDWKKMRYTGLPHIGFAYSFGGAGTQYVQTEYQQVFNHSFLLNVDYIKYRSNGFLRNGDFSHNDFQLQLLKKGKIYSFELKGSFESSDIAQNNGLIIDTLANDFPLIFLPVLKENARTKTKRVRLYQSNYFDFAKDSVRQVGLFTQHELSIKKFVYTETDTLYGLYSTINFDSLETMDQHQWSQIASGAGIFFKNNYNFLKIGSDVKFWNFQNLGRYRDTTEVSAFGIYNYSKRKTSLINQFEINILGAQNEFSDKFLVSQKINNLTIQGLATIESKLPDYYQRYAIGNNYNTNLQNPEKQQRLHAAVSLGGKLGPISFNGTYSYSNWNKNYYFIDNTWRNDVVKSLTFHQFSLRSNYRFRALNIQPNYIFTLMDKDFRIIPMHQFQSRIFLKRGIFKARKMIAYTGIDVSLSSDFQRTGYSSNTNTIQFDTLSASTIAFSNLHFFAGFQIEEFKFFVRMENLGYFWNDRNIEVANGYPIASTQIRIGLTWDFFN